MRSLDINATITRVLLSLANIKFTILREYNSHIIIYIIDADHANERISKFYNFRIHVMIDLSIKLFRKGLTLALYF